MLIYSVFLGCFLFCCAGFILIFIFFFVKLCVHLVELRARAIAQSCAKNHRVTQRDNGFRINENLSLINFFFVELSVFLVALCAIAIAQSYTENHGVTQSDN